MTISTASPPTPDQMLVDSSDSINTGLEIWLPTTDSDILNNGAVDISGNGRDASPIDSSLTSQGSFTDASKGACYFCSTGHSSSGGLTTQDLNLSLSTGLTVNVWFKYNDDNLNYETLWAALDYSGGLSTSNYQVYKDSISNRVTVWKKTGSKNIDSVTSSPSSTTVDTWHMATMRIGSTFENFVDGVSQGTNSDTTLAQLDDAGDRITIARTGGPSETSFQNVLNGYIQNFRLWSRPLSDTEIATLYSDPWSGATEAGVETSGTTTYFRPVRFSQNGEGLNLRRL